MKTCKSGHERSDELKLCKVCKAESKKAWDLANKDREAVKKKVWVVENKDRKDAKDKEWRLENSERNRENHRTYQANRRATDPLYKLTENIRNLINKSLRNKGYKKTSKAQTILGCDFETLDAHLTDTALTNYGYWSAAEEYHVDHFIPLSSATTEAEINKRNHYTNLQYLYPHHNLAKRDKLDWTIPKIVSL